MELIIDGEMLPEGDFLNMFQEATLHCLKHEGIKNDNLEISITFVSENEIKDINNEFRGINKVTDVLSFPQFEEKEEIPEVGIYALGDVVICVEQAKKQSEEFGHSFERELTYLFVHSIFHLLGHDHMEDEEKSVMRMCEEDVMNSLGLER
ncbi:MAG: rRNA maturation RNase YbeY [Anaerovoracaceae bacterium]